MAWNEASVLFNLTSLKWQDIFANLILAVLSVTFQLQVQVQVCVRIRISGDAGCRGGMGPARADGA